MKRMMVGSIDNRIWYGPVKDCGIYYSMPWKREDVTDDAIRAVFEWMLENLRREGGAAFQIRYPSVKAVMEIRRENGKEDDDDKT